MEGTEWDNKKTAAKRFLIKLDWKICTGEIEAVTVFRIDVYKFMFTSPLVGETLNDFVAYLKRLDVTKIKSIMRIFIWLYQREIHFRLKFKWNRRLPITYNLKSLFMPMKIRRALLSCGHDELMACPLEISEQSDSDII